MIPCDLKVTLSLYSYQINYIHTFTSNVICSVHAGPEAGIGTFFPDDAAISNAKKLNQCVIPMITQEPLNQ